MPASWQTDNINVLHLCGEFIKMVKDKSAGERCEQQWPDYRAYYTPICLIYIIMVCVRINQSGAEKMQLQKDGEKDRAVCPVFLSSFLISQNIDTHQLFL